MTTYDIELGQGDGDSVCAVLKEDGVGADLTGSNIVFSIKSDSGSSFDITCEYGANINGSYISAANGGVTLVFTSTHTVSPDIFFGKFVVSKTIDNNTTKTSFPSGADYVSVKVWEAT